MADSFLERLRKRRVAVEGGDPTGGPSFDRRNTEAVRTELGESRKISKETSKASERKRSR